VRPEIQEAIKKVVSLMLVLVALSFLLTFVSSLDFSRTGLSGFIGLGPHEKKPQESTPDIQQLEPYKNIPVSMAEANLANLHKSMNPPQIPIFFVEGLNTYTNKLRLYTAVEYLDGKWIKESVDYGDTVVIKTTGHVTKYRITPVIPFSLHIPVAKDTAYVTIPAKFDQDTGTYLITQNLTQPYDAFSTSWKIEEPGSVVSSSKYTELKLSQRDIKRVRSLAQEITANALTDYEKVVAIMKYLKENYEYDPNYKLPPKNVEPVTYFLFENKKGVCREFATAYIALARSIDIPARAVIGYLAKPIPENQTVMASQAHMWVEVKFENGWLEIDPTPQPKNMVPTITEITYSDPFAQKGKNFIVKGYVMTEDGFPVPDGFVEIHIKKNKTEKGILLGVLQINRGWFEGKVKVPDVSGKYHVIAHYVGSLKFKESWSDPIIRIYSPPELKVQIPDKIASGIPVNLTGRIVDYNGTPLSSTYIYLRVDGRIVKSVKTDDDGFFTLDLLIKKEGLHQVSIEYPGSGYILPLSINKIVDVGRIELLIENKTAIKGKDWESEGKIFFKGEPFEGAVIKFFRDDFQVESIADINGSFKIKGKIPEDFELGEVYINFTIAGVGFEDAVKLNVKAETEMDVSFTREGNKSFVYVLLREKGRNVPAFGTIKIGDRTAQTNSNGLAVFEYDNLPYRLNIVFEGNKKYLPTAKEISTTSFPYWALSLLLPIIAYILITRYRKIRAKYIVFEIEREEEDLPLIWDVNEDIKIRIKNYGDGVLRVLMDDTPLGTHEKGLEIIVAFEEAGKHKFVAERLVDGKVKERAEIELQIMNYRDAIIAVFSRLVKNLENIKNIDLGDYTAREILKMLNALNGKSEGRKLLRLFELSKYALKEADRKDFVEAFRAYRSVRGDVGAK
jgi:transglutaminase-like putative cysteine protease